MMVEIVLDTRISNVSEDGDVAEVSGQVAIVFSDLHLSLQRVIAQVTLCQGYYFQRFFSRWIELI